MSREQVYVGFDGVLYADQRRKELLDRRIKTLEMELARLKKLRRALA